MYGKFVAAAGPAGALAYTGLAVGWYVAAGFVLLFAGIALVKLVPKRKK